MYHSQGQYFALSGCYVYIRDAPSLLVWISLLCVAFVVFFLSSMHRHSIKRIVHSDTTFWSTNSTLQRQTIATVEITVKPTTEGIKKTNPVLILFWSMFFGQKVNCGPQETKLCNNTSLRDCNVPCEVTSDRNRAPIMLV